MIGCRSPASTCAICSANEGQTKPEVCPGPVWLNGRTMTAGTVLRIEVKAPAIVRWSHDGWQNDLDVTATDSGLGIHFADPPTSGLASPSVIVFTVRWTDEDRWEGVDFSVTIVPGDGEAKTDADKEN